MSRARKGFTLIELLVVISLIGILSTLVLANLNAARQRGRDATRKSDMRNIQTALRLYYNDYDRYPMSTSASEIAGCGSAGTGTCTWDQPFVAGTATYMNALPGDPTPSVSYQYTFIDADSYTLESCLENVSDTKGVQKPGAAWCPTNHVYEVKP